MPETSYVPLADRMRPRHIGEYAGQAHIVGPERPLRRALEAGNVHSMVLWGPPGTGKTTLARLVAAHVEARFVTLSAVTSGVKDIRQCVAEAELAKTSGNLTVLFVDEVHRFNKSQQDAFLPWIENGTIVFIGATTENPSFELNRALLSRLRVYVLKPLEPDALVQLLRDALLNEERGLGARGLSLTDDALEYLGDVCGGDARRALTLLEVAADLAEDGAALERDAISEVAGQRIAAFDKGGDIFYDQISALHKSVRGSNPDAAMYWIARMMEGGCDPHYLLRRLVRIASEDIGNADPRALAVTVDAWNAFDRLGSPEGDLAIAQAAAFLASAAKSNAIYTAWGSATKDASATADAAVPMHIRNAPTALMKEVGAGDGYRYDHDQPDGFSAGQNYFPEQLGERIYYRPVARGLEIRIGEKLERLRGSGPKGKKQ